MNLHSLSIIIQIAQPQCGYRGTVLADVSWKSIRIITINCTGCNFIATKNNVKKINSVVKEYILYWNSYKSSVRTSTDIQRIMCGKLTVPPVSKKGPSIFLREITQQKEMENDVDMANSYSLATILHGRWATSNPWQDASKLLCLTKISDTEF